jgi:PKD repeat protein
MPKFLLRIFILFCFINPYTAKGLTASFTVDHVSGCVPLIVNFTNTSTGATSYSWDFGNTFASAATNPITSYITAGTYTVTLTAYNGPSSATSTMVITVYPLPTVNFTADDTTVCFGIPVTFTSSSTAGMAGGLTQSWNFGDGFTGTGPTDAHTYSSSGFYNVTLYATNSGGCTNSKTKNSYVQVYPHLNVNFTSPTISVCSPPISVPFTNTTTGTAPLSYVWSFGDGGSSTATNPSRTYTTSGIYDVKLNAIDGNGCKDSSIRFGYINVGGLTADFAFPIKGCIGVPDSFYNTSSAHISAQWNFGDGGTSGDEHGVHTYTTAGTYNVRLIVYDGTCFDTMFHPITIYPNPTGSFTISPTKPCPAPVALTFNATIPTGATASWLFGDDSVGTGNPATHTYASSMIHNVTLVITDVNGCVTNVVKVDTINSLVVSISANVSEGCVPLSVNFTSSNYSVVLDNTITPPGYYVYSYPYAITGYSWDFGDGSALSASATPSHVYTSTGIYLATCTLTTQNGCSRAANFTVKVGTPPVATLTLDTNRICASRKIRMKGTSSLAMSSVYWRFGDGSDDSTAVFGIDSSVKTHSYSVPGIDTISFTAYQFGCPSLPAKKAIYIDSPWALFGFNYLCSPVNAVHFGNASIGASSVLWIFGDGDTSTLSSPTHNFLSLSNFNTKLTTYNATTGCRDTFSNPIKLTPIGLTLKALDTTVCINEVDTFVATNFFGDAVQYRWYVNGVIKDSLSNSSSRDSFFYAFPAPGFYSIMVIAKNFRGCFDTVTKLNYVNVAKPVANFTASPISGCGPLAVNFTDASTYSGGIYIKKNYWSYGDTGVDSLGAMSTPTHTYSAAGTYTASTTVIDSFGCAATYTSPIAINVYRAAPNFTSSATNVCLGTSIHFNNTSAGITGSLWMFGDGSTSTAMSPDHVYTTAGTYTVKLVVYESHGCSDTLNAINYIHILPKPVSAFTMSDSFAVCPPLNVVFTNTSTGAISYYWTFGTGASSIATSPSNPYTVPGYYTIKLAATNALGCTDTSTHHASLFGYSGAFSYAPLSGCAPLGVHFSVTLGTISSIFWDFSDGFSSTTTTDTTTHIYTTPGAYVPKLILTDTSGCSAFSYGLDTIKVNKVIPHFRINPNTVCIGNSVAFTDSSYSYFSPLSTWSWSFGGGATSTLANPTYAYTLAGTKTVTLTATNAAGCSGTVTRTVTVNPSPSFDGGLSVCQSFTSTLTATPSGGTWAGGTAGIATISSGGVVTGIGAGTAGITYTAPNGCVAIGIVTVYALPSAISGPSTVCEGAVITLSNTSSGGTWSSSPITTATVTPTTGIVRGIAAGTATISYVLGTGCIATKIITVNPQPGAISGGLAVCVASTTSLTNSVAGGTWASSNLTVATINTSGVVSGLVTGTTNITYTLPAGCFSTSVVTVVPLPGAITGPTAVCETQTITLSNSMPGGSWSSSAAGVATVNPTTGVVTGVLAGTTTITYMLGTGCLVTRPLTVNPQPGAISGGMALCEGSTITLGNTVSGGTWSSSAIGVASIDAAGVVTGVVGGTTVISYILPAGCFATAIVTVMPLPGTITGLSNICAGLATTFSSSTSGGTWTSSAPATASIGPVTGIISTGPAGVVTITYTLSTGCKVTKNLTIDPLPANITGSMVVCEGQTTTASSATPAGTWISSNLAVASIDAFGVITGVSNGTATIIYVLPTGCMATTVVTVQPAPGPITGVFDVCEGDTTVLSDTTLGGTWSSSAFWLAPISGTGVVTGVSAGATTITYTAVNGCYATQNVNVNPLPGPITGIIDLCIGSVITLSNATAGGAWSSSNPSIALIDAASGQVTGLAGGTVNITYTMPTGCYVTAPLTVNAAPPAIAGSLAVCAGFATNLTNGMPGGSWSSSGPAIVGYIHPLTGVVTGVTPGTITVTYTVLSGCFITAEVTVNPLPPAITGAPVVCVASTTSLANSAPGGLWASSNTSVASVGIVSGVVTGVGGGSAIITYTIPTGCFNILPITVNPLPAPITGVDTVCTYSFTVLSSATPGGAWSSSNAAVATVGLSSGIVTGVAAGVATISYTLLTGCYVTRDVTVFPAPLITGSPGVCLGFTTTLSTSLPGGTWSSSNATIATVGSSSGIVSGLVLGTFNITYSVVTGGCKAIKPMTVNPLPPIHTVTGGGAYCAGGSGVHMGLTGSNIGISYLLYLGPTVTGYITGTGAPLDFGLHTAAGTYTALATNAVTGCKSNMLGSATVIITPNVTPIVGISSSAGDTLCPGTTSTFMPVTVTGGTSPTYVWRVNGVMVSTASSYTFIPADGDLVSVKMTSNLACVLPDTAISSKVLTVLPTGIPSVSVTADPGDTVCEFTLTSFSANPVMGGASPVFHWILNGSLTGSGPIFNYVPNDGDALLCRMISNYQCRLADTVMSGVVNMVVGPLLVPHVQVIPHPGFIVSAGMKDSLTTIVTDAGPNPTYQWYINGVPVVGATNATFVDTFKHYDSVSCGVTSSGVCEGITTFDWVFITVTPAGTHTVPGGASNVMLIPNPNNGNFTIKGSLGYVADEQVGIEITNMLGQVVYKSTVMAYKGKIDEQVRLDNSIANGMYILNLSTTNENKVFHVVVGK